MVLFTDKETDFIVKHYPSNGSKYCAKNLNKSVKQIQSKVRRLKLKLTKEKDYLYRAKAGQGRKKILISDNYKVKPNQFINRFTKESAYLLGLLWADGYIKNSGRMNTIELECIEEDAKVLYPIFLRTGEWRINYRNRNGRRPQAKIGTNNYPMASFLRSHGYSPNTFISANNILQLIPKKLYKYWFRGLSDGDGCFYVNMKSKHFQFSIFGGYSQEWDYLTKLFDSLDIKYSISLRENKKSGKIQKSSSVRISNKQDVVKFGDFIYDDFLDDEMGLKRKFNKYMETKQYALSKQKML